MQITLKFIKYFSNLKYISINRDINVGIQHIRLM